MKKYLLLAFVAFLFFVSRSYFPQAAQSPEEAIPNPHLRQVVQTFDAHLQKGMRTGEFPGLAVAIVYKDEELYAKRWGLRSVHAADSVDEHTVFRLASVSKSFAGILTGMLVDNQDLDWSDPVQQYLPDFQLHDAEQSRRVKLQHLLSHTTGLPYHTYTNLVEAGLTTATIMPELKTVQLIGPEGSIYSYQNAAFSLIALVIQEASGQAYEELLQTEVFEPIGMKQASTSLQALHENQNVALPHRRKGQKWLPRKLSEKYYNSIPAGGVNASVSDMAQYLKLLLGQYPKLIDEPALSELYEPLVQTPIKKRYFGEWPGLKSAHYAMGLRVLHYANDTLLYHGGSVNGYHSGLAFSPQDQIGICILMNAPGKFSNTCVPTFFQTFREQRDSIALWEQNYWDAP